MKKLWRSLVSALLICAMLTTGAYADADVVSDAVDAAVPEVEVSLGEADDATALEGLVPEGEVDAVWEDPAAVDAPSDPDGEAPALYASAPEDGDGQALEEMAVEAPLGEDIPLAGEVAGDAAATTANSDFVISEAGVLVGYKGAGGVVTIPEKAGITAIGAYAFSPISDVGGTLPNTTVTGIVIPAGVTEICPYAFVDCTAMTAVVIPSGVKQIGESAFAGCTALTGVTLPDTLTELGESAFAGCTALTSVILSSPVSKLGDSAFAGCAALTSVILPDGVKELGKSAFAGCAALTGITLPDSVATIGEQAFSNCSGLLTVKLPAALKAIPNSAFNGCASLGEVAIPDGVTRIGASAFNGCAGLASAAIPDGVTTIGKAAFSGCAKLAAAKLPAALKAIPDELFKGCAALKEAAIPSGVEQIGWNAFAGCTALASVTIPDTVTTICGGAFNETSSLAGIVIPGSVRKFDNQKSDAYEPLFQKSGLKTADIKEGIQFIQPSLFQDCADLASVTIPSSVIAIRGNAFANCAGLKKIAIPGTVRSIEDSAFENHAADLTIETTCNSAAMKYATAKGIAYTATGHTPVTDPAVAAACTTEGKTEGSHCSVCNAVLVAQQVIPATGHTPVTDPAIAPTFGVPGKTEGSHCSVCNAVLVAQQEMPALNKLEVQLTRKKSNGTITVNVGDVCQLVPAFATSAGVTVKSYKSSKAKVATVDASGLVTAVAAGKTKITVKTANKKVKATLTIKVVDPYMPTGVSITQGKTATVNLGEKLQLSATLAPAIAKSTLKWKSSKPKVATVDANGLVTPVAAGKTKITVVTRNKKKAKITVKVVDPTKPTGVVITQGKTATMKVGEKLQLSATLSPTTAMSALKWKTSKKKVATVDANGLVTALKKGKVKITVTTRNKKKATITITVTK